MNHPDQLEVHDGPSTTPYQHSHHHHHHNRRITNNNEPSTEQSSYSQRRYLTRSVFGSAHLQDHSSPPVRLRQMIINKIDALRSTVNLDPKTHKNYYQPNSVAGESSSGSIQVDGSQANNAEPMIGSGTTNRPVRQSDDIDRSALLMSGTTQQHGQSESWKIHDRLRLWRDDARAQHLYETAAFWGAKVYAITSEPNDAFWLAQVYFLTGQFFRAEKILTGPRRINTNTNSIDQEGEEEHIGRIINPDHDLLFSGGAQLNQDEDLTAGTSSFSSSTLPAGRLTDFSTACRYLAAQCMIRQGKWDAALDMVGDDNPFRYNPSSRSIPDQISSDNTTTKQSSSSPPPPPPPPLSGALSAVEDGISIKKLHKKAYLEQEAGKAAMDGGIKFESSMCYIRGLIHLQNKSLDRAKESFLESLALDVKCFESFEALIGGNMLEPDEEWEFVRSLGYHHQTPEDALFIKSLYTVRLKKFDHKDEMFEAFRTLKETYKLTDDPDASFGLADWLFTNYRFQDCYRITSRILSLHDHHSPTLPLHLTCMAMMEHLKPSLFLLAHQLIERDPNSAISWYGAGLWYFSQKRWEESRRFFSKSALLDSRFAPAWFAFGHALAYEGEHDQAITAYSTASHNFQGSHLPLMFIGMQHIQLANPILAMDYLTTASEICPSDPLVMHEKGVVCYYQEQWEEAIQFFEEALKLSDQGQTDPKVWAPTHLNLSHCYRRLGRFQEAFECAQVAKSLQPRSASILTVNGMACHGLGRNTEAIKYYHESLAIVPADPMTTNLLKFSLELETIKDNNQNDPKITDDDDDIGEIIPNLSNIIKHQWKLEAQKFNTDLNSKYGQKNNFRKKKVNSQDDSMQE